MKKQTDKPFRMLILPIITIVLLIAVICSWFFIDGTNSKKSIISETDSLQVTKTIKDSIKSLYNFSSQNTAYNLTFLEFGATTCRECKKMEEVMKKVKEKYKNVNVIFYNVRKKENNKMVDYFGIQMIPVQILLDKNGTECFRHLGYYPFDSLKSEFNKFNNYYFTN